MMLKRFIYIFVVLVVGTICASAQEQPHINSDDYIIHHTGYTLSYNLKTFCPDWVAWKLTRSHLEGNVSRKNNDFQGDPAVPKRYRVTPYEYKKSGYDRGHMCPAGDNKWNSKAMKECFYMTNMCPQDPTLNQRWWNNLENSCRRWAKKEGTIYICTGPIFSEKSKTIGGKYNYSMRREGIKVYVPKGFFKVVLSLRKGNEKAIGFIYANDDSKQPMADCCMTVDEVEKITGIDFFASLEDNLEKKLESKCNISEWK